MYIRGMLLLSLVFIALAIYGWTASSRGKRWPIILFYIGIVGAAISLYLSK
jgi:hypothetical protein